MSATTPTVVYRSQQWGVCDYIVNNATLYRYAMPRVAGGTIDDWEGWKLTRHDLISGELLEIGVYSDRASAHLAAEAHAGHRLHS